jgi:hypothetical protein
LQVGVVPHPEYNIENKLDLASFFPWAKSDVLAWWMTLGILGLGPNQIH